jgi:peptidyl-prolyl cis-trans isomerase D
MWLLFGLITFVFVFTFGSWGGGDVSGQTHIAATVNGHAISMSQFRVAYQNALQNMQMYRPGFTPEKAREEKLDQNVLDNLIRQELLAQLAEERGLRISDDEVAELIQKRFFGDDKPFDAKEYKRMVNGYFGTSEPRFEAQVRRELLAQRLEGALEEAEHVSPALVKEEYESRNNRVDLDVVRIDPAAYKAAAEPTDAEVAKFATDNAADIQKFYDEHMSRYSQPKRVRARHILAKAGESAADDEKAKAKAKIEATKKRIDAGEDFATVAKEVSEDSTAEKGGDLGFFGPGMMVPAFEEAAYKLKAGEVSGVVTTKFGFHIIKVEEVQEAQKKELDVVKNEIAKQLLKERAQLAAARKVADAALAELQAGTAPADLKIPNLVKPQADGTPAKVDDPTAPRVESTGFFAKNARYVPRVGVSPDVVAAGFALTKESPVVPKVMEIQGRLYLFKLKARELPEEAKFADEKERIEQSLLAQRRARVVEEFVKNAKESAKIAKNTELFK